MGRRGPRSRIPRRSSRTRRVTALATAVVLVAATYAIATAKGHSDRELRFVSPVVHLVQRAGKQLGDVLTVDPAAGRTESRAHSPIVRAGQPVNVVAAANGDAIVENLTTRETQTIDASGISGPVVRTRVTGEAARDVQLEFGGDTPYRVHLSTGRIEPFAPDLSHVSGPAVELHGRVTAPVQDATGALVVLKVSTGQLYSIRDDVTSVRARVRTGPKARLAVAGRYVVVLDTGVVTFVSAKGAIREQGVPGSPDGIATRNAADAVAVLDPARKAVTVVPAVGKPGSFPVANAAGGAVDPPVLVGQALVVHDQKTDHVAIYDTASGKKVDDKKMGPNAEVQVGPHHAIINDPANGSFTAIDENAEVTAFPKYPPNLVGAQPEPEPEPTPTSAPTPPVTKKTPKPKEQPPPVRKPERPLPPIDFTGIGGDHIAVLSWSMTTRRLNGATSVDRFTVTATGAQAVDGGSCSLPPTPSDVPGGDRTYTMRGLSAGCTYSFTITATTVAGTSDATPLTGPPPLVVDDVPAPPTSVQATPDPSRRAVVVTWAGASGEGHDIVGYRVVAHASGGSCASASKTSTADTGTTSSPTGRFVMAAGRCGEGAPLTFGVTYTFTVTTKSGSAAAAVIGSPSEPSNAVIPIAVPQLDAVPVAAAAGRGTLRVTWSCDELCWNGETQSSNRSFRFLVDGTQTTDNTFESTGSATYAKNVGGLADDQDHSVTVIPVNSAGAGAGVTTSAHAIGQPVVTITGIGVNGRTVTINFTVDVKGSTVTGCEIELAGAVRVGSGCGSGSVDAPYWSRGYTAVAHAASTEFGWSDSAGAGASVGPRPSVVIDTGVARVSNKDVSCKPGQCQSYVQRGYRFGAVCWDTGFAYYRAGVDNSLGTANWWIRDEQGMWIQGLFTDADNGSNTPAYTDGGAPWGDIPHC